MKVRVHDSSAGSLTVETSLPGSDRPPDSVAVEVSGPYNFEVFALSPAESAPDVAAVYRRANTPSSDAQAHGEIVTIR